MDEIPEGWDKELYEKLSFEYLIECAENKRIDEWNSLYLEYLESEWKRVYPEREWDPKNVVELVSQDQFIRPDFSGKNFREAISRGVGFMGAHLGGADFIEAHLKGAYFMEAHLEGADFFEAHLEGADFSEAHLEGAYFMRAHLVGADFSWAHLERAYFQNAYLEGADFQNAYLEGAYFLEAHLAGANLSWAIVNENTLFQNIIIDDATESMISRVVNCKNKNEKWHSILINLPKLWRKKKGTDFSNVALGTCRIDTLTKTRIEKNIRVYKWNDWYKNHGFLQIIMRPFWFLTDYGASTIRPVCAFILWNTIFSLVYFLWLGNDFEELMTLYTSPFWTNIGDNIIIFLTDWMKSNLMIISLTDMATTKIEPFTLFFVFLHVFVGYFILAALVARLSIMFQNLSPNNE